MNPDIEKDTKMFIRNGEEWEELRPISDFKIELDNIDVPEPKFKMPASGGISGTIIIKNMTAKTFYYKIIYGRNHWIKRFLKYIFDRL